MTDNQTVRAIRELHSYLFEGIPLSQEKAIVDARTLRAVWLRLEAMQDAFQAIVDDAEKDCDLCAAYDNGFECGALQVAQDALAVDPLAS